MLEKNNKTNKKGAGWGGFMCFISFIFKFFSVSFHLTSASTDNIFHPFDLPILLLFVCLFVCCSVLFLFLCLLLFCFVVVVVVLIFLFSFVLSFLSFQTKYELVHNGVCTRAAAVVECKTSTTDRGLLSPPSLLRRLNIR